jgi:organic radical activating enzyme
VNPTLVQMSHSVPDRQNTVFVAWTIGNVCNYRCSYCPPQLRSGSRKWLPIERILAFAERLAADAHSRSKTVCIQLSTGEVTLMPGFLDLIAALKRIGCQVVIISNASKSTAWWAQAVANLDQVVLSFHPETTDLKHFTEVANVASAAIRTHLNIAAPPHCFDIALHAAEHLATHCTDVTLLLKPMLIDFKDKLYPYSSNQLSILRERVFTATLTHPIVSIRGDMVAEYSDGEKRTMGANQFLADGLNRWRDWECNAGVEVISIKYSGAIFRGVCGEGGPIGNIDSPDTFVLPTLPVRCTRSSCSCLLDIMTTRRLPTNNRAAFAA